MKVFKLVLFMLALAAMVVMIVFLVSDKGSPNNEQNSATNQQENIPEKGSPSITDEQDNGKVAEGSDSIVDDGIDQDGNQSPVESQLPSIEVDTNAESISVIVNQNYKLPEDYSPNDLVYPNVRFTFKDKIEKRMMRKAAAEALETMFDAAEVDGIYLAGVSAYRSHATQKALFKRYVERDGYEKAKTYSAEPGTSEHETGLAIDVSASDGKCAAEDCFGGTVEALWLAENAANYGFIIRYPEGKEDITGYKYEPWHLRYVGVEIAKEIESEGLTLEEYYQVVPVKQ